MVHFSGSGSRRRRPTATVKVEVDEDSVENKRMKHSPEFDHQLNPGNVLLPVSPAHYNPLDEPSPLGLRLRKSPSLLELIQMRLSQGSASKLGSEPSDNVNLKEKTAMKGSTSTADKLKAANFPASLLKIGGWEYVSRYEGDLVAKCYFAKHKLVWEILDGGLKSKIEIQWSDIMGLKADIPDDGQATLSVVLARQPLFFRETNPQPRKHTLWQATADFTEGHASLHRQHYVQVPNGLLNKHFEKLIQCDARLNFLSRQPEIVLDSPYFDTQGPVFTHSEEAGNLGVDLSDFSKGPSVSTFQDIASPTLSQCSSISVKQEDIISRATENVSREASSPSSVMDMRAMEAAGTVAGNMKNSKSWEQMVQGLRPSMSMADIVNHLGNCISGQASSQTQLITEEGSEARKVLEDIAQYLLSDSQSTACSDEKSLMSRVDSLCCLIQDTPPAAKAVQLTGESSSVEREGGKNPPIFFHNSDSSSAIPEDGPDLSSLKSAPAMSRKDSYSELLLHLPRIASLPKFLFDISEDGENQAR